jgi:acetyltransferase
LKKPILIVKSGRTQEGARAASSHTGAIAATDVTVSAFLDQCGVIRANTLEEMFDIAQALDRCPSPRGNRVAILTNAGGPAIMATDSLVGMGLELAEFGEDTVASLRSFLPVDASVANPVDMIAAADVKEYDAAMQCLLDDPGVDMVLAIHVAPLTSTPQEILCAIDERAVEVPDKPVAVVMMSTEDSYANIRAKVNSIAVYRFPESAAVALTRLREYAKWRNRPQTEAPEFSVDDDLVARMIESTGSGYMSSEDAFRVLEAYGIPVVPRRSVESESEALRAAEEIGYPVVLKAFGSELIHKSDVGAVAVDLRSMEEFYRAFREMETRIQSAGIRAEGYLVQKMIRGGHEVIFGLSSDRKLGSTVMFGLGGKYVEVFRDVRFGVPPLTQEDAGEVIHGLRGHKLLEGVRGEEPVDRQFLVEILLRLVQLTDRHPQIAELDINPFIATPRADDARAVDVRIRVG